MSIEMKSGSAYRGTGVTAAPCVDCDETGGYLGPNSKRPWRIKGRCVRCHDRHRKAHGKPRDAAATTEPGRRYDVPTPLLLARYEALGDLRTPEAVEMADEIACRVDESRCGRLESERYVYLSDKNMGFTRAARRFHRAFPPVRGASKSTWSKDFPLFVTGNQTTEVA